MPIAVGVERLATEVLHRWQYAAIVPVIPPLGARLLPVLQWILLPPLIVEFVRRRLT